MIQINGSLASKLNKLLNKENDNLLFSEDRNLQVKKYNLQTLAVKNHDLKIEE